MSTAFYGDLRLVFSVIMSVPMWSSSVEFRIHYDIYYPQLLRNKYFKEGNLKFPYEIKLYLPKFTYL